MESIELQTRPRNISRSNNKYKNNNFNNNPSPIIKNFDPYINSSSNKTYKNEYIDSPNFIPKNRSNTSKYTSSKKNSRINDNNNNNSGNSKVSDFNFNNNFPNRSNNLNSNINNFSNSNSNNNSNSQKDILGGNTSRSTDNLLLNEKGASNASLNFNQEHESLINLSCEALYYYLKEKGLLSKSRILLLTVIVYLLIMITHSMNYSFLLFNRPIYLSYQYECVSPMTKTIMPCTSRNVCFCEDMGRCVTTTWASDIAQDAKLENTYYFGNKTFISNTTDQLKFKFGEILHFYIYDYKKKVTPSPQLNSNGDFVDEIINVLDSEIITVNYNYKKKDKFCLLIFYCFLNLLIYNCGSFMSELVFGYLSDYIGKYIIINILAVTFAINQIIYFCLFNFLEEINSGNNSNLIWGIFAFFLGTCTTPLKSFITCFYLELFPNKEELFSANGLIQSATSFSFIWNFIFLIKVKQIKYIFLFFFVIAVAFIVIFIKYFRENPRFYSENRNLFDEMLNIELKKLAIMQIMDTKKIQTPILETVNQTEKINETKKTLLKHNESITAKNSKDDLIFKKEEIEKKIRAIKKMKSKNTKRMNFKKDALHELNVAKKRKCPCPFLIFNSKRDEDSDDSQNEIVKRNTLLNRKRLSVSNRNFNNFNRDRFRAQVIPASRKSIQNKDSKILRRHGLTSKDISGQDFDTLTKDLISYNYENDLYIKKYIFTYALVKLSFAICYTSQYFYVHNKITDPNSDGEYRKFSFLFYIFFFTKLAHILAGKFSFFINSRTLIIICLIIYGFIMIFVDLSLIYTSTQKIYYFGQEKTFYQTTTRSWMRIFAAITIAVVNSLFEISIISYPPTLYRGKVMMKINLLANIAPIMTYVAVFLIDTWAIYIGILALIILFLYFTRLNDLNLEILESRDEAYVTQIKMYINKRFSKINIVDKVDKNN